MAIIMPYDDAFGNSNASAYWRVYETNITWGTSTAHVTVSIYKSKAARNNGKQPVASKTYDFSAETFEPVYGEANLNTNNPVKATYLYLKTLPEYSEAVDDL